MRGAHTEGANDILPASLHLTTGQTPRPGKTTLGKRTELTTKAQTRVPRAAELELDDWTADCGLCVDCGEGRLYSAAQRPEPEVGVEVERGGGGEMAHVTLSTGSEN